MQASVAAGSERKPLLLRSESRDLDCDFVGAQRHGVEMKFAGGVRSSGLSPVGSFSSDDDPGTLDGTMLRIMDQATDRAEDCGAGRDGEQKNSEYERDTMERHWFSEHCRLKIALFLYTSVGRCGRKRKSASTWSGSLVAALSTLIFGMSGDGQYWRRAGRTGVAEIDSAIARGHLWEQSPGWLFNAAADGRTELGSLGDG